MGRQSHLARLALGRSPFDPPLQDENGEFILGPNVQHDTRRDYIQDFDSRGHPRNIASQISRRRLLRAQNEALSTVGVVVRKAKANRTHWQTMSKQEKFDIVVEENTVGAYLGIAESILQKLSTQWILNLRQRVLTYKSYLGLSIPQAILSEWNTVGPGAFFVAGLFSSSISRISRYVRTAITEEDPFPTRQSQSSSLIWRSEMVKTLRRASLQIVWFTLEYPFYAYTVLQALYLLPPGFRPSLLSLIPFKDAALWTETPITWRNQTWSSLASFLLRDFRHPIVLAFLRDRLSNLLFPKLYVHLRELLVKPNRPDGMSLQGGSAQLHIVPGKITTGTARRLARGGGTVKGVLGRWLSNVLWFSLTVLHTQRVPMAIELSPEIEVALIELSVLRYHTLARHDRERGIIRSQRMLRVMAIRAAFREFNLDPDSSMVDIFELADELANEMSMYGSSRASTSTPEPQDLPPLDELLANTGDGNENEVDVEIQVEVVIAADEGDGDARSAIRRLQRSTTTTEPDLARDIHLGGTTEFVPATEESNEVHALPGYVSIEPPPEPPEPATERSPGPREASPPRTSDSMGVPIGEEQAREAFNTRAMPLPPVRAGPEPLHYISYEYGPQVAITLHGIGEGRRTIGAVTEPAFQPTVPLDTLLEPTPSGFEDPILPEPGSPGRLSRVESLPSEVRARHGRRFATSHGLTPSPPVPGITRAASLSHAPLRPLRRPTISDQQVPTFRQREAARRQAAGPRDSANTNTNSKSGTYRVTMLSNHAAEALAYHATSLLESIILLPLDVMFTRSLARNFLARHQHHPLVPQLTTPSLSMSGIWPLGLRAQMRELTAPQEMRFWGNFLVTIGVQGLINLGIWAAGVGFTLSLGESFGWGKM